MRHIWILAALCCSCEHLPRAQVQVVNPRDLPEETAIRIWHETGVYRGLTDDEWQDLLMLIDATKEMR